MKSLLLLASAADIALAQFCEHQWEGRFAARRTDNVQARQDVAPPPLDIQPLIINGPSENRIDLIFFGDGCTAKPSSYSAVLERLLLM